MCAVRYPRFGMPKPRRRAIRRRAPRTAGIALEPSLDALQSRLIDQIGPEQLGDEVLVLLSHRAQLRNAEILLVEAPASEL